MTGHDNTDLVLAVLELRERLDRAGARLDAMTEAAGQMADDMRNSAAIAVTAMKRLMEAVRADTSGE